MNSTMSEIKSGFEVLARKAWAKVQLERAAPDQHEAALKEFRAASRQVKKMDDEELKAGTWDDIQRHLAL